LTRSSPTRRNPESAARLPVAAVRRSLVAWYRRVQRDLPWRRTSDPYRILLSETMLQQTRVDTVIPYYERFLEQFPDLGSLACADEQDVLRQWAGLGYYARARNLKKAAMQIMRDHDGRVPSDPKQLLALPGIGRYTAGAVRSIAFEERAAIVDGNVRRVLSRLLAAAELAPEELWQLADELVPAKAPGEFNQALMELGATVCTPRAPDCAACPLGALCAARAAGEPERFPQPVARRPPIAVTSLGAIVERNRPQRVLLLRRPSRGLLGGMWEIPAVSGDSVDELVRAVEAATGLTTVPGESLGTVHHQFTHRSLTLQLVRLKISRGRIRRSAGDTTRFCSCEQLDELPLSRLVQKALEQATLAGQPALSSRHGR
jgi:A/G-specific adenine glycosylase